MITILSGGRGTPKLIEGIRSVVDDSKLTIIVNTADDIWWNGLYISPDVDTILYLFSGLLDTEKYWGVKGDTFNFLNMAKKYDIEMPWFNIGDKDLAIHIVRTYFIYKGYKLNDIISYLSSKLGIKAKIFPATNDKIDTYVTIPSGKINIQEYLVKFKAEPEVLKIEFSGLDGAKPAPGVINSILNSKLIVIGPSNPINSIGPIIWIKDIYNALLTANAVKIGVSPIKGSSPFSGPADKFMRAMGYESSPLGLAQIYSDLLDYLIIDYADEKYKELIFKTHNIYVVTANISLDTMEEKISLARKILELADM